jgi:Trk-type K+ transport system membrane component
MLKTPLVLSISLLMAAGAYAQSATGGITMSTDPARIAAVERHAQELKARPAQEAQAKPAATHSSAHKSKAHATPHSKKPHTKK